MAADSVQDKTSQLSRPLVRKPKFKRIIIKLSGEALIGSNTFGVDSVMMEAVSDEISEVHKLGVEIAIVVGGGNIIRGVNVSAAGFDRASGDYMGMLATVINALALQSALEKKGTFTRVLSAIHMAEVAEPFIRRRAIRHLEKRRVVILAAGTGNPYFSTDTAAALRGMEIGAEIILKGTKVEGVYDSDPESQPDSQFYERITYDQILTNKLAIMDAAAISLCRDNNLPILVFNLRKRGNIKKVVLGERVGSLIDH